MIGKIHGTLAKCLVGGILVLMLSSLCIACSRRNPEEELYKERSNLTAGKARIMCHAWDLNRIVSEGLDWSYFRERRNKLIERIEAVGFDWQNEGRMLTYEEVASRLYGEHADKATAVDSWGRLYEFKEVEGLLVVRSAGSDGVFDRNIYYRETFPWLSGGDILVVDGNQITSARSPEVYDWLHPQTYENREREEPPSEN